MIANNLRNKKRSVYLDYAATTPVDPEVRSAMISCLTTEGAFGNPSSTMNAHGIAAAELVEEARRQIASLLGCQPSEFYFTSGATEANNLAIQGIVSRQLSQPMHVVISAIEHKSALDICKNTPCDVTYVRPGQDGVVSPEDVAAALRPDTRLVSVMHVNNETGVKQPIEKIAEILAQRDIIFHVDAAQSIGKLPINLNTTPIDLLSLSAHKFYGPKGIGGLFVRRGIQRKLRPLFFGGGQEKGLRPGTIPVHQVVGFGKACELAAERLGSDFAYASELRSRLLSKLANIDGIRVNGAAEGTIPHIVNCSFAKVDGEALALRLHDVSISVGSACSTGTIEVSHVLRAMGLPDSLIHGAVRLSFGRSVTLESIDYAAARISEEVDAIRRLERAS